MKNLFKVLIAILVLSSCKTLTPQQRAENRIAKISAKYPELQTIDTVSIPEIVYRDSLVMEPLDTSMIDSLLFALAESPDTITVKGKDIVRIRTIINQEYKRAIESDTLSYSDSLVDAKFWIKDGVKHFDIKKKEQAVIAKGDINVTKTDNWLDKIKKSFGSIFIWIIIILAVVLLASLVYKFIKR